ncbi:MAG TPA: TlpA disulfide reductase family protein [Candidatus Eisenbacteria bacterium]|nr:TlpA disulfide reductase family protein [Candidatus Eisenbacteria bacterium]
MKPRVLIATVLVVSVAWIAWRSQLWTVERAGARPEPLVLRAVTARTPASIDAILPAVPVGTERLVSGRGVLLVHYWAPWEHASRSQLALLDSLRRDPGMEGLKVTVVCFDPFPSVARYVARQQLRLTVLIDQRRALRENLPCPSVPYTYVLDSAGRIAVAQPGEVDWWAPETRATLEALLAERDTQRVPAPPAL